MTDIRPFLYGGIGSVFAECCTFPIDTTKTRLQVQGQTLNVATSPNETKSKPRFRGMFHALYVIPKEEGFLKLYGGLQPALFRQATYGTIRIGLYHKIRGAICEDVSQASMLINIASGMTSGAVASLICNPTDVLKLRLQARSVEFEHLGLFASFIKMFKTEGVRGMWRGVGPNAQRAAVVAGVELPVYDQSKKVLLSHGWAADAKSTHFISSLVAGFFAVVVSNPIDVMKTRIMTQLKLKDGSTQTKIYKGTLDCFIRTVKSEGFMALYKGFIPNYVRLGPWTVIFFMTFEQAKLYGDPFFEE